MQKSFKRSKVYFICLFTEIILVSARTFPDANLTAFSAERAKRSLIFEGGGQLKFVIGPIFPLELGDPVMWRSLICLYNLHGGHYDIATEPLYPWDKYESIFVRSMRKIRHWDGYNSSGRSLEQAAALQYWADDSRLLVYRTAEAFMNKHQRYNGRSCLLRAICENAQVQQHIGILAELLNVVLTPGKEKIDEVYGAAYEAGKSGVDCLRMYEDCPMGSSILDAYWEFY